jgi:hypothetical protein
MKRTVCIALATIALILANSLSGNGSGGWHGGGGHGGGWHGGGGHGGHGGVSVWVGPGWWGGYPYYPYYYPYYNQYYYPYYNPYYGAPPAGDSQQPSGYVQQEEPSYWYFCQDPKGYYPYVKQCPKGWLKVVPSPTPKAGEE